MTPFARSFYSRGPTAPRDVKEQRERGRRSAAILSRREGSLAAPAPVACRAEGAITSSAGSSVRLSLPRESLSRPGPLSCCAPSREERSAAADGRPYALLPLRTAPIAGPGICGELHRTPDAATVRTPASTGHRPRPAKPLSCCVPCGRGWREYEGVRRRGDKFFFTSPRKRGEVASAKRERVRGRSRRRHKRLPLTSCRRHASSMALSP